MAGTTVKSRPGVQMEVALYTLLQSAFLHAKIPPEMLEIEPKPNQEKPELSPESRRGALAPHFSGTSPEGRRGIESPKSAGLAFIWETVKIVIISLAIIVPIRYYLVQPFFVKGASMETNFEDGNYILIDEISYQFKDPARGEVVVFRFPEDKTQFFIKRIIGLPEETVEIKNNKIVIHNKQHPEGFVLEEKYLSAGQQMLGELRMKLDPKEYFVMGDNRLRSSDSRRWGSVNRALITGRVFFRAWPFSGFGRIPAVNY